MPLRSLAIVVSILAVAAQAWMPARSLRLTTTTTRLRQQSPGKDEPLEYNDFDDFIGDSFDSESKFTAGDKIEKDEDVPDTSEKTEAVVVPQLVPDRSACRTRRFSLGREVILDRYLGTLGFEEVTDWQYYMTDQDEDGQTVGEREKVSPNPFDPAQPRRTRQSSGSVLRLFRGEFVGALGGLLRGQAIDNRILIKEFSGELGLALAEQESRTLASFQSQLVKDDKNVDWRNDAMNRSNNPRPDNSRVLKLIRETAKCPHTILLGEVDLGEVEDEGWDYNEFYRSLGVPPPKPGAIWLVYEYTGVGATAARLTQASTLTRWDSLPRSTGFLGKPQLPAWSLRADYLMRGIVKQAVAAVADTHEAGLAHRSIGVPSLLILPRSLSDKTAALSPFWTNAAGTVVKLSDWGFSIQTDPDELLKDEDFVRRARSFEINMSKASPSLLMVNFCLAEDMHALGVAIVQLLLATLAEPSSPLEPLPIIATNEDSFQRVWTDIYDRDMMAFRDYLQNEDNDIYTSLVNYLDEKDGWVLLDALLNARERVAKQQQTESIVSIRKLLQSRLFG
jgi:hypothetical protein